MVQLVTDQHLATVAAEFPRLERLELLGCDLVTGAGLTHLVRQCGRLDCLRLRVKQVLGIELLFYIITKVENMSCVAR